MSKPIPLRWYVAAATWLESFPHGSRQRGVRVLTGPRVDGMDDEPLVIAQILSSYPRAEDILVVFLSDGSVADLACAVVGVDTRATARAGRVVLLAADSAAKGDDDE